MFRSAKHFKTVTCVTSCVRHVKVWRPNYVDMVAILKFKSIIIIIITYHNLTYEWVNNLLESQSNIKRTPNHWTWIQTADLPHKVHLNPWRSPRQHFARNHSLWYHCGLAVGRGLGWRALWCLLCQVASATNRELLQEKNETTTVCE